MNTVFSALLVVFLLAGCVRSPTLVQTPVVTDQPTLTVSPIVTSSIEPTKAVATATQPAAATETLPIEETPATLPVITGDNVGDLVPYTIPVENWIFQMIWPAADLDMPDWLGPRPDLLLHSNEGVYPVVIDLAAAEPAQVGSLSRPPLPAGRLLAIAPDAASMLFADEAGQAGVYDLDGNPLLPVTDPPDPYGAGYSSDGDYLAVTSHETWQVTLYETKSWQVVAGLSGFETAAPVYNVLAAPGGQTIVWIARATLQFQDVASGAMGAEMRAEDFYGAVLFSPDGQRLYAAVSNRLEVYNLSGVLQASLTLSEPARWLAISPDGKILAGAYGGGIQIWDAETLAPLAPLASGSPAILVSFSPDGRLLASFEEEQRASLWW